MAEENIMIKFEVDYAELDAAIATLEKTGKLDPKVAQSFQQTQKAITGTATDTKGLIKQFKDVATASVKMGKTVEDAFGAGVQDALDEAGVSAQEFAAQLKKANAPAITLKKELQQLKDAMARMKAEGKDTGKEFDALRQRAGKLSDAIADANMEIKNAGSDTKGIDNVVGSISALAGGYAAVQGAAALFGDENEDLQKALLKVNSAMAIATGIQQVSNALQKEGALIKLKDTIATGAQTAATTLYTFVMGGATVATKVFRAALLATGIGALVVLVVSLVQAMSSYGDETKEAKEAQDALRNSIDLINTSLDVQLARLKRIGDERIAQLESEGVAGAAISKERIKLINQEIEILKQKEANSRKLAAGEKAGSEEAQRLYKEANDFFYQQEALKSQIKIIGFNDDNKRREEQLRKEKEFRDKQKKALEDAIKEAKRQALEANDNGVIANLNRVLKEIEAEQIKYDNIADMDAQMYETKKKNAQDWDALWKQFQVSLVKSAEQATDKIKTDEAKRKAEQAEAQAELIRYINNIVNVASQAASVFSQLSSLQTERDNQEIASQKKRVEAERAAGILSEKQAAARIKNIEEQEKEARYRAALREKKAAVFQSVLAIPKAFLQGLTSAPPPYGAILGGIAAALAAAEAAIIASRPVPRFFRGKKGNYEGIGEVADMGSEIVERNGRMFLYTKPTQTYLGAKDKVYTASETRNIMHNTNISTTTPHYRPQHIDMAAFAKAIPAASLSVNIDRDGVVEWTSNKLQRTKYMDKRYSSK